MKTVGYGAISGGKHVHTNMILHI